MILGLWKSRRIWNSEKRDGPLRQLQLMIIPFKPEDTLVWVGRAGSWQVDRLLFGDGVDWTWTMLMLSEDSFRILVSPSEEKIQIGAGISNIRKKQVLWSCNLRRAAPWEADSEGGKFGVFSRCYFTTFDVRSKHRIESLGGYMCDTPAADWT